MTRVILCMHASQLALVGIANQLDGVFVHVADGG
jgi:hypothetical protein